MFVVYLKASRSAADEEGASRCHLIRGLRSKSYLPELHNALHILHLPLHAHLNKQNRSGELSIATHAKDFESIRTSLSQSSELLCGVWL